MQIDTSFDCRIDAAGQDPDSFSATLRQYHRTLWSKPLPSGRLFNLTANVRDAYLHHRSEQGEFILSSDSIIPTFTRWKRMQYLIEQYPEEENEAFRAIAYTIGGMMIFPGNKVDGKPTLNAARGFNSRIADRFDLTLECIRRHYLAAASPLSETLGRYREFFGLFGGFREYVDFFLLQDLVVDNGRAVRFFMPFDNFVGPSVPSDRVTYSAYRIRSIEFIEARNARIRKSLAES